MPLAKHAILGGCHFIADVSTHVDMTVLQLLHCDASMSSNSHASTPVTMQSTVR